MAITEIIHFTAKTLPDVQPRTPEDNTIQKAINALKGVKTPRNFFLGKQIQNGAVQITSEWNGVQDYENFETTPEFTSFIKSVHSVFGEPNSIFHVDLNKSAFGPDGAATANVVEYVQSYFPVSRVTPEFQKQVEEDFLRFDEIYIQGAKGNLSWAFGWVLDEQEHENIKGEKAKCLFVTRGWESMDHFEQSVKTDAYKKSIPILFAWNAPFKMVSVYLAV
jgi:hypothetical protein